MVGWPTGRRALWRPRSRGVFRREHVSSGYRCFEGGAGGAGGALARGRLHALGHAVDDSAPEAIRHVRDSSGGLSQASRPGAGERVPVLSTAAYRIGARELLVESPLWDVES